VRLIGKNISALFLLYVRPVTAVGRILDHGRIWFSAIVSLSVAWLLHAAAPPVNIPRGIPGEPDTADVLLRVLTFESGSWIFSLAAIAVALVPGILLIRAISGYGSFGVLMESDYLGLLNCSLLSWTAAFLPVMVAGWLLNPDLVYRAPVFVAATVYFLILLAFSVRGAFGIGVAPAAGLSVAGVIAAVVGGAVFAAVGGSLGFLMSPLLLYYAYIMLGSNVRSLGQGLRSRQHLRQQLEIATNNPHDADAQYQIGLIHQKRHQYSEAIERFTRAARIDRDLTDAHFQLGVIARQQGRLEEAIQFLELAVSQDDKHASSDVWRELGAAYFGVSRIPEAAAALAKFTGRREYDPEGLYWYGKTLLRLDRPAEARQMFERAIEAARTMPRHRRAEVRKWGSQSKSELSALRKTV
jgi:Tfp pilus assembly protein PilF/uncharacterized membrane protein